MLASFLCNMIFSWRVVSFILLHFTDHCDVCPISVFLYTITSSSHTCDPTGMFSALSLNNLNALWCYFRACRFHVPVSLLTVGVWPCSLFHILLFRRIMGAKPPRTETLSQFQQRALAKRTRALGTWSHTMLAMLWWWWWCELWRFGEEGGGWVR